MNSTPIIIFWILVAIPFIVGCIKGAPGYGLLFGFFTFLVMFFTASSGSPAFLILGLGVILSGVSVGVLIKDG